MAILNELYPGDGVVRCIVLAHAAVGVVAACALLFSQLFPRNASVRHALLLAGLFACLSAPGWAVALAVSGVSIVSVPAISFTSAAATEPIDQLGSIEPEPNTEPAERTPATNPTAPRIADAGNQLSPVTAYVEPTQPNVRQAVITLAMLVWLGGSSLLAVRFARAFARLKRIQRSLVDAKDSQQQVLQSAARRIRVDMPTRLAVSNLVRAPMAIGLRNPVIVLPSMLDDSISSRELEDILVHEMAHIIRRDQLIVYAANIARILFWPTGVILLLDRHLSRAREEVCDNFALQGRERLEYAETLLKVAEWSCGAAPPAAATGVLHWPGELEQRVVGIVDGQRSTTSKRHPLLAIATALSFAAITVAVCGVTFAKPETNLSARLADQPTNPNGNEEALSIDALVAKLASVESRIKNLSVTTEYVKLQKDFLPVEAPVRMKLTTEAVVDMQGRSWSDTTGDQVNIEPNGKDVRIYQGRWRRSFDGKVARAMEAHGAADAQFSSGSISLYPSMHGVDPKEFTTHYFRKPLSQLLAEKDARIVGKKKLEGRSITVVETKPTKIKRKYVFWIDVQRGVAVKRAIASQDSTDKKWREYTRIETFGYRETADGVWLPQKVKYESLEIPPGEATSLSWSYQGENRNWRVNRSLPDDQFVIDFPEGIRLTDRRPNEKKALEARKRAEAERKKAEQTKPPVDAGDDDSAG